MDPLFALGMIILIVIVVAVVLTVLKRVKMARDPEYAAQVNKKRAAKELERQKRKMERAQLKIKRAKYEEAIAPAKHDLLRAKQDYNSRVERREDDLHRAIKDHDKAIRDQEKLISEIEKKYSQYLESVGNVKLFLDRIAILDEVVAMNSTMFAEIRLGDDLLTYGGRYPEFFFEEDPEAGAINGPGTLIGGIGAPSSPWPVAVDPRFHYLFVYGSALEYGGRQINICIPLDDKVRGDGEKFAFQFNQTAERAETTDRRRARELEEARARLDEIRSDTRGIEDLKLAVEREKENRGDIEVAQRKLEEAEMRAQEELDFRP